MKKKVIAILVTLTLMGGVGTSVYAGINSKHKATEIVALANKGTDNLAGEKKDISSNSADNINKDEGKEVTTNDDGFFSYISCEIQQIIDKINSFFDNIFNSNKDNSSENSNDENSVNNSSNNVVNKEDNKDKPSTESNTNQGNVTNNNSNKEGNNNSNKVTEVPKNNNSTQNKPVVTPPSTGSSQQTVDNENFMAQVENLIFQKVNEERTKAGASALTYNKTMEKYARIKSKDMADRGYFDHKDPQGNLITDQMKKDGVSYNSWGENIAYIGGVSDVQALANQFMTNWMNSPGHRQNILSPNFSSIGLGVYKSGNKVYATQEFYR